MTETREKQSQHHLFTVSGMIFLLIAITGCASRVTSEVTRFNELSGVVLGSARVVPKDAENENSLEFESYAALVGAELGRLGFSPPEANEEGDSISDFIVEVGYGVSDVPGSDGYNPRLTSSYSIGFYPYAGYSTHSYRNYHGPHGYRGFGVGYGYPVGYAYVRPAYTRHLELSITRTSDDKRVFEGNVESIGRISNITEIMPYLVLAMFEGYPGISGETHRVSISIETDADYTN